MRSQGNGIMKKISEYNHILQVDGKKYVYNSFTKSSISIKENFEIEDISKLSEKQIQVLYDQGFLTDTDYNEYKALKYMFNRNYFTDDSLLNIVLVPGMDCNFKCPYCFEKVPGNKSLFKTDQSKYFSALKKYAKKTLEKYKNVEISLFGGEPLIFAEEIFDFFDFINNELPNLSYFSSIVTNGALLNSNMVKSLIKYQCKSIQVTIDGWKGEHNKTRIFKDGSESYQLLIDNINTVVPFLPDDCLFNLRINLNNVSVDEVKTTLEDINKSLRNKIRVLFRPIYNTDTYKYENSNKLYNLKPFFDMAYELGFNIVKNTYFYQACESCSGDNFYFIMPDLSIWKCINNINFIEANIGKIINNGDLEFYADRLIKWYEYSNCFEDDQCKECKLLPDCYGGCVLYRARNGVRSCKEFEMAALPYLY